MKHDYNLTNQEVLEVSEDFVKGGLMTLSELPESSRVQVFVRLKKNAITKKVYARKAKEQ